MTEDRPIYGELPQRASPALGPEPTSTMEILCDQVERLCSQIERLCSILEKRTESDVRHTD